jgi:hypothetical protein
VFKESFPLARNELKKNNAQFSPQLLDATDVRLDHAYLVGADLAQAWLVRASLREAQLEGAQLEGANLEMANPEDSSSLEDTEMNCVTGLTPEQREKCLKKRAIFDAVQQAPASATSSPSSLPPEQSNDGQAPSAPSVQGNTPPPSTDGSSASSSQQGPAS